MRALLSLFLLGLSFFSFSQSSFDDAFLSALAKDDWQSVFSKLQSSMPGAGKACATPVVSRLLFGHAALLTGRNNTSTMQFYCACDSLISPSLAEWLSFAQSFQKSYPSSVSAHYVLADAYARQGIFSSAKSELDKGLKSNSSHVPSLNLRGVVNWLLYENSNPKDQAFKVAALQDVNSALRLDSNFADLYANKALFIWRNSGDLKSVRSVIKEALLIDPSFYLAFTTQAVTFGIEGKADVYYDSISRISNIFPSLSYLNFSSPSPSSIRGFSSLTDRHVSSTTSKIGGSVWSTFGGIGASMTSRTSHEISRTIDSRGGIYSPLIEGDNLVIDKKGAPILIGSWFNFNYPSNMINK